MAPLGLCHNLLPMMGTGGSGTSFPWKFGMGLAPFYDLFHHLSRPYSQVLHLPYRGVSWNASRSMIAFFPSSSFCTNCWAKLPFSVTFIDIRSTPSSIAHRPTVGSVDQTKTESHSCEEG